MGFLVTVINASNGGFTVELMRRGSPKSPFKVHPNTLQSEVTSYKTDNIMKLSMGTPPVDFYGLVDTDGSFSQGVLAKETVTLTSTLGEQVSMDIVGCGHNDNGIFIDHDIGIIGLRGGSLSFVSQIASTFDSKSFSHCFTPFGTDPNIPSKMTFGSGSQVSGDDVVSTPLICRDTPLYSVTVRGISVGDKYLPYDPLGTVFEGNVFLDSGTPNMYVPQDLYLRLVAEELMTWCVANPSASEEELILDIKFACDKVEDGCRLILEDGKCLLPDTLIHHASVAMNQYYKLMGRNSWNCDFRGSALITMTDPSRVIKPHFI
ncbi:aspartic proteinase CDR1-like [Corylus avellana]|uniref:aspartic proteinase CDR1-like n=1 Tax=Corylus avellana TaxID=13451 RepID=UPI00286AD3DC|nr:aspartic proteinase CDR1-like [Corylus avellana]